MPLSRTREFFKEGGVLVSVPGGRLAKSLAALGVAAAVAVIPVQQAERGPGFEPAQAGMAVDGTLAAPESAASNPAYRAMLAAISAAGNKAASVLSWHAGRIAGWMHVHKFGKHEVPQFVAEAVVRAARDTGFPPDMLMAIAEKESSFDVNARPPKGSALGLMQFLEQTWLEVVRDYGEEFGLAAEAAAVKSRKVRGTTVLYLDDPAEQARILDLRRDPYLSSAFAAKNLMAAKAKIEAKLEAAMAKDDLYLPHFLGTHGAQVLLAKSGERPQAAARKVFPKAARFNAGMFRGKGGKPLTVRQFHERARAVIATRAVKYRDVEARVARVASRYAREAAFPTFASLPFEAPLLRR